MLERIAGCRFNHLTFELPKQGTILGGNMNLHGNNLTLACFYGINFKAKFWALFTMEEPFISFSTESQDLVNDGTCFSVVVERLLSMTFFCMN